MRSVSVTSKRHLLLSLAQRVAAPYGVEERDVLEALQSREQEGSTGAGDGGGHCRMPKSAA